jgi:hypothetical protein
MLNKVQLNDNQIALAKTWLADGCEPYAYNGKVVWFWQTTAFGLVKNALTLDSNQRQQLDQLAE